MSLKHVANDSTFKFVYMKDNLLREINPFNMPTSKINLQLPGRGTPGSPK